MKTVLLFFTGFILSPIILEAASFWHTTPLGFVIYQVMAFSILFAVSIWHRKKRRGS